MHLPTPFAIGAVNAYVLPGTPTALVDCGPDTESAFEALESGLAEHDVTVSDLRVLLITHRHVDHLGLASRIHRASGATVIAHPEVVRALTDFPSHWRKRLSLLERAARAAGVPRETIEQSLALRSQIQDLAASVPTAAMRSTGNGRSITCGGCDLTSVYTPGHTSDHVCFVHRPSGAAFTGDLMLRHLATIPYLEDPKTHGAVNPLADLVASWRLVGGLALSIAWPGHGRPVRAHRILVARRLASVRSRLQSARRVLQGRHMTAWELASELGLSLDGRDLPATLGESVALLRWLAARGLVDRSESGGLVRFRSRRAAQPPS